MSKVCMDVIHAILRGCVCMSVVVERTRRSWRINRCNEPRSEAYYTSSSRAQFSWALLSTLGLRPKCREDHDRAREENAEPNAHAPDSLALVTVCLRSSCPSNVIARLVNVIADGLGESKGVCGIGARIGITNETAVEVGERFAEDNRDHDEGDQPKEVEGGHDDETEVGVSPKEGDGNETVKGRQAGNCESADDFSAGGVSRRNDFSNEVSRDANDADEGY